MSSLEQGIIGNGSLTALVDGQARIVWACLPRMDGDPAFCELLQPAHSGHGVYAIVLENLVASRQYYLDNTAVLVTELEDRNGGILEVLDFAPRHRQYGRIYHPLTLVRRLRVRAGTPRIRVLLRPLSGWGARIPERTWGSNHVRFLLDAVCMRLNSDVPVSYILEETAFVLDREYWLVLGPDETLRESVADHGRHELEHTIAFWQDWVRYLALPVDWQDAVIRAAITLKLCQDEDSGGIIAAPTTSIPEAPGSGRNWDYRYCWLRDAAFVVRALNRLGATHSMEHYLRYVFNIAVDADTLQPMYSLGGESRLTETSVPHLAGYRGMGPVRVGNAAYSQRQHDVYGSVILASTQRFFDHRLIQRGGEAEYRRLVPLGHTAAALFDQPDAGIWEYRERAQTHTYSATMCWVACDRLDRIARHLGLDDEADAWAGVANGMRQTILARAWNPQRGHFTDDFDGERLDASLLLMADVGLVGADDPRYIATVDAIGTALRRANSLFRYVEADDFGLPETSFILCTFWYIEALAAIGRRDEARELFESMLARRNRLGLLSEDMDVASGELWGNFPQAYSMVGLIHAAIRLSRRWEDVL